MQKTEDNPSVFSEINAGKNGAARRGGGIPAPALD